MANPLRRDPTRTTGLRRRFMVDVRKRFTAIKRALVQWLVVDDQLGLALTANVRDFAFTTSAGKVQAFRDWLQTQVDAGVLLAGPDGKPWTQEYIDSAYKQGASRAYIDAKKADAINRGDETFDVGKEEFLRTAFGGPEAVSKVELLATRSFEQLRGVTATMGSQLNTILAGAIADGRNPRDVAREMANTIDGLTRGRALTIARTEIIHAHAEGQLDSFTKIGVEELGVLAEWITAGDARVCPRCAGRAGKTYTVEEARGLIPLHPNCRCMWIPSVEVPPEEPEAA